jgi:hypothetical protein
MSYFILQCFAPPLADAAGLDACPEVPGVTSWMSGRRIAEPVPQPIVIDLDPECPGVMLEMYQLEMLIMTEGLVQVLRDAGVDNLQVFDAIIRDPAAAKTFTHYKVVNVVGVVSCADLSASTYSRSAGPPKIDVDFDRLVIDESRAGGQLLFRLAECLSAIVVHEKVRDALVTAQITGLTFQRPEEFVG